MGDTQNEPFQLSFNASLRVDFQGSRVTSDGGLMLVRELDEHLGFGDSIARHLTDSRRGKNTQFSLADLLRQSVYSRLAGYEDVNDAERLGHDPTFRLIGSEKVWDRGVALTPRLQSFETELLAGERNLTGLTAINRDLIAKAEAFDSARRLVLDMDSTEIPVYGQQEQSAAGGRSVGDIGGRSDNFTLRGSPEKRNASLRWSQRASSVEKPPGRCIWLRSGVCCRLGRSP